MPGIDIVLSNVRLVRLCVTCNCDVLLEVSVRGFENFLSMPPRNKEKRKMEKRNGTDQDLLEGPD